jgi:hypothetical protein
MRPGTQKHRQKTLFFGTITKEDIPFREEKEEEWEMKIVKSLHIRPCCFGFFPMIQPRSAHKLSRYPQGCHNFIFFPTFTGVPAYVIKVLIRNLAKHRKHINKNIISFNNEEKKKTN